MKKKEQSECSDKKCPIHGGVIPRGRTFIGVVVSLDPHRTAVVEWDRRRYVQKYERYEKKRTKISVHNPECINAQKGDRVQIHECRPLSKTKKFTITKIVGKEELFAERERLLEESKTKSRKELKEEAAAEEKPANKSESKEVKADENKEEESK